MGILDYVSIFLLVGLTVFQDFRGFEKTTLACPPWKPNILVFSHEFRVSEAVSKTNDKHMFDEMGPHS